MPFVLTNFPLPFGGSTQVAPAPPGSGAAEAVNVSPSAAAKSARLAKAATAKALSGLGCCCDRQTQTRSRAIGAHRTAAALARRGMSGLGIPSWVPDIAGIGGIALQDFLQTKVSPQTQVTHQISYQPPAGSQFTSSQGAAPALTNANYTTAAGNPQITTNGSAPAATQPSWFSQETIISGVSNGLVAGAGVGGLLLLMMMKGRRRS
jgi:hypothetical protein